MDARLTPSQEVMDRMRERYERIRTIGGSQPAVLSDLDLSKMPEWMDGERLKKAQATAKKYYLR